MTNVLDLYDHEVKDILRVQQDLRDRAAAKDHNYESFEREVRYRFAEIGFEVDVNWYRYGIEQPGGTVQEVEGAAMPEITITGRIDKGHQFDHDRQVHEAVSNILQLPGQEGWIKTDPETLRRFMDGGNGHGRKH
jgi:hypothetical protein